MSKDPDLELQTDSSQGDYMDFSGGNFRDSRMHKTREFEHALHRQLGRSLSFGTRKDIIDALKPSRDHGSIHREEALRALRDLRKAGKISSTQLKIAKRKLNFY